MLSFDLHNLHPHFSLDIVVQEKREHVGVDDEAADAQYHSERECDKGDQTTEGHQNKGYHWDLSDQSQHSVVHIEKPS